MRIADPLIYDTFTSLCRSVAHRTTTVDRPDRKSILWRHFRCEARFEGQQEMRDLRWRRWRSLRHGFGEKTRPFCAADGWRSGWRQPSAGTRHPDAAVATAWSRLRTNAHCAVTAVYFSRTVDIRWSAWRCEYCVDADVAAH